jgi:hypothetical protein
MRVCSEKSDEVGKGCKNNRGKLLKRLSDDLGKDKDLGSMTAPSSL